VTLLPYLSIANDAVSGSYGNKSFEWWRSLSHKGGQKKKWFQVTYPTTQLPSGMHGRSCATWVIVRIASLLPAPDFRPTRINARRRASRLTPGRNLILGTAFRSLEKTARYRATFPKSMLLAYPFGSPLSLLRTRSIRPLVHAIWLAPDGANSLRQSRCPVPSERSRPFFLPPLPFRAFGPLPIKAVT
jgi:hypothetical protein